MSVDLYINQTHLKHSRRRTISGTPLTDHIPPLGFKKPFLVFAMFVSWRHCTVS